MKNRPRIIAYTMLSVAGTARRATGAWPVTCPPFDSSTFDPRVLQHADIVWLGLHGTEQNPDFLYGDEVMMNGLDIPIRQRALDIRKLFNLDLRDKIVFATSCHLPETNFPDVLKRAGAVVIGGPGKNYGNTRFLTGADKLGAALVAALRTADTIEVALSRAKLVLSTENKADVDAREFGIL